MSPTFDYLRPRSYSYRGVPYVAKGSPTPKDFVIPMTCGTCGRTWDDSAPTAITPTPAARCPFEHWHRRTA